MADYHLHFCLHGQNFDADLTKVNAASAHTVTLNGIPYSVTVQSGNERQLFHLLGTQETNQSLTTKLAALGATNTTLQTRVQNVAHNVLSTDILQQKLISCLQHIPGFDPTNPLTPKPMTIQERMESLSVPGVRIAVIDHGVVVSAGFGQLEDATRLIQAASISKTITALTILSLVNEGKLSLDDDVGKILGDELWAAIDEKNLTAGDNPKVTIRHLLAHTAGTSIGGFPGYNREEMKGKIPTKTDEILKQVKLQTAPDMGHFEYSGGGTTILQKIVEIKSGKLFADAVKERIFDKLGMKQSMYTPDESRTVTGNGPDGLPVPGGWFTYPELAAAGLWTTPSDLAKVALAIQHSLQADDGVISRTLAKEMIATNTPNEPNGLGVFVNTLPKSVVFSHQGANAGFQCIMLANNEGQGAVVMTNSDNGQALWKEVVEAIAKEFKWTDSETLPMCAPLFKASEVGPVNKTAWAAQYAGTYTYEELTATITCEGDKIFVQEENCPKIEITPLGPNMGCFQEFTPGPYDVLRFSGVPPTLTLFNKTWKRIGAWKQEEHAALTTAEAVAKKYWERAESHDSLLGFLKGRLIGDQAPLVEQFEQALATKNKDAFITLFKKLSRTDVTSINFAENLGVISVRSFSHNRALTDQDKKNLEEYLRDTGFQGAVSITSGRTTFSTGPTEPFCIYSLGKVFTGMLLMTMIQEGVIDEETLDKPVQLEEHVLNRLPKALHEPLKTITLRQVMTHTSGLGDYLGGYLSDVQKALDTNGPLPKAQMEDMLEYADTTITPLKEGEQRYSNVGSLLFGLSLQCLYNKKHPENTLSYSQILQQHILKPPGITSYSETRPSTVACNPKDPNAYVPATPAGGQWMTAEDLQKFGQWIAKRYQEDNSLLQLLKKHGSEFYSDGCIEHLGAQQGIGSAYFSTILEESACCSVLTNQERLEGEFAALKIHSAIMQNILTEEPAPSQ